MRNKTTGDKIFETIRLPALVFLLIFAVFKVFGHEVQVTSPHTGKITWVDITPPLSTTEIVKLSIVAEDWRQNEYCTIDQDVVAWLHDIVKYLAAEGLVDSTPVVHVLSGFRTVVTNELVGGVPKSMHLKCKALDISIEGVSVQDLYRAAKDTQIGGLGYYPEQHFIHIDSGRLRSW